MMQRELSLIITAAYRQRFPQLCFGIGTLQDCTYFEKNEAFKLLGIEKSLETAIYKFRGRLLEKIKLESPSETGRLWDEKFKPFAAWAGREHPRERGGRHHPGIEG
jgi:hypothetical protein